MRRFLLLFFFALLLPAQTLDKPPQDIDDALRARIKQFYDFIVAGKYRSCEQLIAEESKDDFYILSKPQLESFRIAGIEYSDNFTKAKAMIVGPMPVLFPGVGAKVMERPFASFWKTENGVWFWYYNKQDAQKNSGRPNNMADVSIESLQSAIKIDRNTFDLSPGKPQTVKLTNTLPGPVSLSVSCPLMSMPKTGITAAFDKKDMTGNDTASLTLTADPKIPSGKVPLRILVAPTNQALDLTVNVIN